MENYSFVKNGDDKKIYVVIYDIADNKRRQKVSKILESYGHRVQESAFECHINKNQIRELKSSLFSLLKNEDDVKAYATTSRWKEINWSKQENGKCGDLIIC